jgi:hypothetical protein
MSRSAQESPCPDCSGELVAIKLFGRGRENPISGAALDAEVVYYTDENAERSFILGMLEATGIVRATMCSVCRRIFLHAVPK